MPLYPTLPTILSSFDRILQIGKLVHVVKKCECIMLEVLLKGNFYECQDLSIQIKTIFGRVAFSFVFVGYEKIQVKIQIQINFSVALKVSMFY